MREAEDPVVEVVDNPEAVVDYIVGKVVGGAESLQGVAGDIGGERCLAEDIDGRNVGDNR